MLFGGCGGAYFVAAPPELIVDVYKGDLNLCSNRTELRAILFGPDRTVMAEKRVPDNGKGRGAGIGPLQHVRLSRTVKRPGVFGLNVTVSNDRYGRNKIWGIRTNCDKYLIETARGHRDRPHEEPIVAAGPEGAVSFCFWPRSREFSFKVTVSPKGFGQ